MSFTCQKCGKGDVYAVVEYLKKYLCLACFKTLGDFDLRGRLDDKRIKRGDVQ